MKIMNILKGIKSIPKPSLKAAQNKLKDVSYEKKLNPSVLVIFQFLWLMP